MSTSTLPLGLKRLNWPHNLIGRHPILVQGFSAFCRTEEEELGQRHRSADERSHLPDFFVHFVIETLPTGNKRRNVELRRLCTG